MAGFDAARKEREGSEPRYSMSPVIGEEAEA
jgi:hypothetical protein